MKNKHLIIAILLIQSYGSFGQLLQWNTFGNTGLETSEASFYNNPNISSSNLTQGTITAVGNGNRFGGSGWFDTGNTVAGSTLAEAIAGNDYIEFIVSPTSGSTFTATSFVFYWDSSASGPKNVALRSSFDGFASNLGVVAPVASIGSSNTITISGLSNIATAITFRVYGYGGTNTGGTGGFDIGSNIVNVALNGSTTSSSCTPPTISSITPAAATVGSQVTITASTGTLLGASVVFNGVSATTVSSTATQLVVTVPTGATTGNLVITDALSCGTTKSFTVLPTVQACGYLSDLFISEVTDTNYGGLSYIEIYNGTGNTVDLSNYSLQFFSNGASTSYATTGVGGEPAFSGMLANGQTYTVSTSISGFACGITGGSGSLANLQTTVNGVNFGTNADDQIILYNGITKVDSWGDNTGNWSSSLGIGTSGADFRRISTAATLPSTTYSNSDWTVTDWAGSGSGACGTNDYSDIGIFSFTPLGATTWNGSSWSNGVPSLTKLAIIDGNYNTTPNGSFEACSVIVNAGKVLTIFANQYVAIQYNLTVNNTGNFIVQDNGSLVQIDDSGTNIGSIDVKRVATVKQLDYVYWSSPVSGFPVTNISPTTASSYIWKWETTYLNPNGGEGDWINTTETMLESKGYIVKAPDSYSNSTATDYTVTFTGTPFNGVAKTNVSRGNDTNAGTAGPNGIMRTISDDNWNLIGNPYPCSISAIKFLTLNTNIDGNIRLWTHGTLPSAAILDPFYDNYIYNYNPGDYIVYNITGTSSGPSAFNGYIASGQGFFVIMNDGVADASQSVTFNNSLRENVSTTNTYFDNSYFYKTSINKKPNTTTSDKGRIWIDLINSNGASSRALVGYIQGATLSRDRLFDATVKVGNSMSIYSLINEETMIIQGRPMPFNHSDIVPLGVRINAAGTYTIAIGAIDGFFTKNGKKIYIEDTLTRVIQDISATPYVFTSNAGNFTTRFKLRFKKPNQNNDNKMKVINEFIIFTTNHQIEIQSSTENIKTINVYDILGRQLYNADNINQKEAILENTSLLNQVLMVKVTFVNGLVETKKVFLN